ncbi:MULTISPECIES: hypothetical protein [Frankia]|nr:MULTISPECIES: hypothetical protein [Frankia]
MAGKAERVRVVLERSGGLLGRPVRRGLDSADLPEPEAARLRELVRGAVSPGSAPARRAGGAGGAGGTRCAGGAGGTGGAGGAAPRGEPADDGRGGGADRFVYTLEIDYTPEIDYTSEIDRTPEVDRAPRVDQQGGRTVRTFSEPVPEDLRPLLALLRAAPLLPAGGRDTPR